MKTDEQLMLDYQGGESAALSELYVRFRGPLFGFFRRRLESRARAEELAQECFVALIHNVRRYEPRASFRSYLFGIAMNLMHAERRKGGRETASDEDPAVQASSENPDTTMWVRRALAELEKDDREILMLREYEELSYEEIAGLLRVPLNTVRSRLFRAREAMREKLQPARDRIEGVR
jgi:RNA polymerase sigma-70 factor, ECF subfamily